MNPIEKLIRDAGGTMISKPMLDEKGDFTEGFEDELLDALEKKPHQFDQFNPDFDKE